MKKGIMFGAAGLGVLALVSFGLLSGFRGGGCGGHGGHAGFRDPARMERMVNARVDDVLDDFDASDAQREKVHAIKEKLLKKGLAQRDANRKARDEVIAQWKSDRPDAARLHALLDERIDAMRALGHEAVDSAVELHGTLTKEQKEKIQKRIDRYSNWSE
jgi:Spy/CpxP family protein refolding chaperone